MRIVINIVVLVLTEFLMNIQQPLFYNGGSVVRIRSPMRVYHFLLHAPLLPESLQDDLVV